MDINFRIHTSAEKTMTIAQSPSTGTAIRSPWHSPVPYLFGGLAAMLGLIAFALLILACSYWRLSGYLEGSNERDLEAGESNEDGSNDGDLKKPNGVPVFEEKFLVIMPGQEKPTCLATPMSSRASSFGSTSSNSSCTTGSEESEKSGDEEREEKKQEINGGLSQVEMVSNHHESATNQDHGQV